MDSSLSDKQGPCGECLKLLLPSINWRTNKMFDKYIPFIVSTKHSSGVRMYSWLPAAINFNLENLIKDNISNFKNTKVTIVSSGSLAEGLDLPGSDIDIMFVLNTVQVIQNAQQMNRSAPKTTLLAEDNRKKNTF
jgi:hypothetical protein